MPRKCSSFLRPNIIFTSVSFRTLPAPSLSNIRKVCQHYEAKCSGQYSSLASRYVLQMVKEIETQVDAMEQTNNSTTCHCSGGWVKGVKSRRGRAFEFDDKNFPQKEVSDDTRKYFQDSGIDEYTNEATKRQGYESDVVPVNADLEDVRGNLLRTNIELQGKAKELERMEAENKHKLQLERRHLRKTTEILIEQHKDEIDHLYKEIAKVKTDAKLVIDFVRRKANKALEKEMVNRKNDMFRINQQYEMKEARLKEKFNTSLCKVESQVKQALHKEKVIIYDGCNGALPSPPQPTLRSNKFRSSRVANASDASIQGDVLTDDSISTRESREFNLSDNSEWFQERINELDEWTDTLTNALRDGNVDASMNSPTCESARSPEFPPPLKRVSTKGKWEL